MRHLRTISFLLIIVTFLSLVQIVVSQQQDCTRYKPTVSISPKTLSGPPGSTFNYEISVKSEDSQGCAARSFPIMAEISGLNFFLHPDSLNILPGQTEKAFLDVTVPSGRPPEVVPIKITVDISGTMTTDQAQLRITSPPTSCTLKVDSIDFFEDGSENAKTDFCKVDTVKLKTGVSLSGGVGGDTNVNIYLNNKLFDSRVVNLAPQSSAVFFSDRKIDLNSLGLASASVKVTANADCDVKGSELVRSFSVRDCTETACLFDSSIATPFDKKVGEKVPANILIKNKGKEENLVHFDISMCSADESKCDPMECKDQPESFQMTRGTTKNIFCESTAKSAGKFSLKLGTITCGKSERKFSNSFTVFEKSTSSQQPSAGGCSEGFLEEFACSGNIRQKAFQKTDCVKDWNDFEYCPFGCSDGKCKEQEQTAAGQASYGKAEILLKKSYEVKKCGASQFDFDVKNSGRTDKFTIGVSGNASQWVSTDREVFLTQGESKILTAQVSLPCEASQGSYGFTISAKSRNLQSAVDSNIVFSQAATQPTTGVGPTIIVLVIVVVVTVFIIGNRVLFRHFK